MGDYPKMQGQCHLPPHLKPHILGMSFTLGSCPTCQLCAHLHEKIEVRKENCKEKKKFGYGSKTTKMENMSNRY
jgi:hypothetical protein